MYTSGFAALRSITEFGGGANIVDATVAAERARIMLAILAVPVKLLTSQSWSGNTSRHQGKGCRRCKKVSQLCKRSWFWFQNLPSLLLLLARDTISALDQRAA